VKRLEHFWKGLSHDQHQISPIPPVPYGDRFIKFITGITQPREEAEREAAAAAAVVTEQTDGVRSSESARWPRESQSIPRTNTDQSVMQRAEHEAILSERRGANENAVPDRILTTIRCPSVERNNDRVGTTLPIVDEVGESSSTGGRSGKSNAEQEDEHHPPTPPKHRQAEFLIAPPVPPKPLSIRSRKSCDSNKALPALPKSESPEEMAEGESIVV
jgi:1-phosphatidylinositol-4-phosphate 5-kinase